MEKWRQKLIEGLFLLLGLSTLLLGMEYIKKQQMQQEIAEKVVRFHVIANSDTKEDQALKLKVRDAVGGYMSEKLYGVTSKKECLAVLSENETQIREKAEQIVAQEGYDYPVETFIKDVKFPVKSYGEYTFPAGTYEALEVVIGAGCGHNWWCVMYPNMCFSGSVYEVVEEDAKESLEEVLSPEEYEEVLSSGNYKVQFKYLSFLNDLSAGNEE